MLSAISEPIVAPKKIFPDVQLQEIYSRGTGRCRIASSKAVIAPGTLVHDNCHGEDWDRRCPGSLGGMSLGE